MSSLPEIFQDLICDKWYLEREDAYWIAREENKTANPELKITGAKAIAFTLDKGNGMDPWPFMSHLSGVRKVCDALVVAQIEEISYVIAVEMKSGCTKKANKQIASAWCLAKWLMELLRLHGHWSKDWKFCGLISSTPRRQERKGTTRRSTDITVDKSDRGYSVAKIQNKVKLNLIDFHNAISV